MRYPGWIFLLLAITALCGCGSDPIVGKWQPAGTTSQITMDFQANGTVVLHFDIEKTLAEMEKLRPGSTAKVRPMMEASAKQMEAAKPTWKKVGAIYSISTTPPGSSTPEVQYLKLDNDQLTPCDETGTTRGKAALVRVK